jgi:hypothetical protein
VRTWSRGLDLWGNLNQLNDKEDPHWKLPTKFKTKTRQEELEQMEEIIGNIDLDLTHKRKKLIIDPIELLDGPMRELGTELDIATRELESK